MRPLAKKLVVAAVCIALSIGVTGAYFSYYRQTESQLITTGNLLFTVFANDTATLDGWLPGETRVLEYTLTNTGSMPFEAKGYLAGEWDSDGLDSQSVSVQSVERFSSGVWIPMHGAPTSVGQEFEVLDDGLQDHLVIHPSDQLRLRLTILLDPMVGNGYQSAIFTSSLHVAARQVTDGAQWPNEY